MNKDTRKTIESLMEGGIEAASIPMKAGLALQEATQGAAQAACSALGSDMLTKRCQNSMQLVGDWMQASGQRCLKDGQERVRNATSVGLAVFGLAESKSLTDFHIRIDEINTKILAWARHEARATTSANAMRMETFFGPF